MTLYSHNFKFVCAIAVAVVLSGCNKRIIPDELVLVKYNPLEIPSELKLVKPDKNAKPLGYTTARNKITSVVQSKQQSPQQKSGADVPSPSILKMLKLQSVDMNIAQLLQQPLGERVVVIIDKEKERLAKNLAQNLPLSNGDTPRILAKKTRAGIDQLFGE